MSNLSTIKGDVNIIYESTYDDGRKCVGCEFNRTFSEWESWGDTVAERKLRECVVQDLAECPGVRREART